MFLWHVVSVDPVPCLSDIHTSYSCWMECRCFCLQLTIWAETRSETLRLFLKFCREDFPQMVRWKCVKKDPQCIKTSKGRNIWQCFEMMQKFNWYIYLYCFVYPHPASGTYYLLNIMYYGLERCVHTYLDLLN